jgi:hypothetical protein
VGAVDYQFEILGLIPGALGSCTYDESQISTNFISDENASNSACLFGSVTVVEEAELIINKQASVTEAQAGDFIDYQIDYNCFSATSARCRAHHSCRMVVYVSSTGST